MKTKLLMSMSVVALLGVSSVSLGADGDWMWYNIKNNKVVSRPVNGKIPVSDCLEMMCEHGCVEHKNDDGRFRGYCCPSSGKADEACQVDGKDVGVCCQSGRCEGGVCQASTCTFNKKTYDDGASIPDANGCGICHGGVIEPKEDEDCKTCNTTNWEWQNKSNESVGQCGMCQNGEVVVNPEKLDDCHECDTEWQLQVKKGSEDKVYKEDGKEKCCSGSVNPEGTVCCEENTPIWDEKLQKCICDGPESFKLDGHKNSGCKDSRNRLIRWENPSSCSYKAKISGSCFGRWGAYSPGVYNYPKLGKLCGPGADLTVFDYCKDLDGFEFEVKPYGYICFDVYSNSGACNGNLDITLTRIE